MFTVYGDKEIWNLQVAAIKMLLIGTIKLKTKAERMKSMKRKPETAEEWAGTDFNNLPVQDLTRVPPEFKKLTAHFKGLSQKYITNQNRNNF